jgi:hypothetical protein
LQQKRTELRSRAPLLRYDRALVEQVVATIEPLDRNTASWAWVRMFNQGLDDPATLAHRRDQHRHACRRVNRHRNLVAHGWSIGEDVARQSADFCAQQLELAVQARSRGHEDPAAGVFGLADRGPDERWAGRTLGELLDAVAAARRER